MIIRAATAPDLPAIAALVNSAYRGDSSRRGWTTEADLLGGQRTDPAMLADDLARAPRASLWIASALPDAPPLGCVWLDLSDHPRAYMGMLTVSPDAQGTGLGRMLMEKAEAEARAQGAHTMRMTVIPQRHELVAWYERCGYRRTGATEPFPSDDPRFGIPMRDDLTLEVLEKAL